jgi:hypothetical protein
MDLLSVAKDEYRIASLVLCSNETEARAYSRCEFAEEFEFGGVSSSIAY